MIITDITELSKTKVKVSIDYGETFALYKSEIRSYNIKKDDGLPEGLYKTLMEEVLPKRAKLRGMNLLKSRDYTKYQIRNKLKQGFYPEQVIDAAIAYLESFGYLDDSRYARTYIMYANDTKGKQRIESELLRKGISKENIMTAYEQCAQEGILAKEEDLINKFLVKKRFDKTSATFQERQKMAAFLYRKGFSADKIQNIYSYYS